MPILVGTAGWGLPRAEQEHFPRAASHLERYSGRFQLVEIYSSFHRSHRPATWMRWRESVPNDFRFSVKIPKTITHRHQLRDTSELVAAFLDEVGVLSSKLGCLLVQLPPKLAFDSTVAGQFFALLRTRTQVPIACEPRHTSWFGEDANRLLKSCEVARVAADPARFPGAAEPGGWRGFSYYRLHGAPKIYCSQYSAEFIGSFAQRLSKDAAADRKVWVIFDNTSFGAATRNALDLAEALTLSGPTTTAETPSRRFSSVRPDQQ